MACQMKIYFLLQRQFWIAVRLEEKVMERTAGILLPVTSLPSKYGIGCFSKSAYDFVDWLKAAGQSYWQILPLGPTSYGDSHTNPFPRLPEILILSALKP